ncbi:hypothetical protein KCU95_g2619, partial [Aureobasidium melanogenum]
MDQNNYNNTIFGSTRISDLTHGQHTENPTSSSETSPSSIFRPHLDALPLSLITLPDGFPEFTASYPEIEYTVPESVFAESCPVCDEIAMESIEEGFIASGGQSTRDATINTYFQHCSNTHTTRSLSHLPSHPTNPPPLLHPHLLHPLPNALANHLPRHCPLHLALLLPLAPLQIPNPVRNPKVKIYMSDVQSKSTVYETE